MVVGVRSAFFAARPPAPAVRRACALPGCCCMDLPQQETEMDINLL